jgi:hypothetical protein
MLWEKKSGENGSGRWRMEVVGVEWKWEWQSKWQSKWKWNVVWRGGQLGTFGKCDSQLSTLHCTFPGRAPASNIISHQSSTTLFNSHSFSSLPSLSPFDSSHSSTSDHHPD